MNKFVRARKDEEEELRHVHRGRARVVHVLKAEGVRENVRREQEEEKIRKSKNRENRWRCDLSDMPQVVYRTQT